jgi:hypothetical protein
VIGQDRPAGRVEALDLRIDEVEDQVEVVDHEIVHDADVEAPEAERRQAVAFDEARLELHLAHLDQAGLETLHVPHGHVHATASRRGQDRIGFVEACGQRLLDQGRNSALEQRDRDLGVQRRRNGDADRIDLRR